MRHQFLRAAVIPGPGSNLWTPANLTTALWLDASDSSTVILSSGKVSEWRDKSGNDRHATQVTADRRPTVGSGTLNSNDVISFDSASRQWMITEGFVPFDASAANGSFMCVQRHTGALGSLAATRSGSAAGWGLRTVSATQILFFFTGSVPNVEATTPASANILGFTKEALTRVVYVNGSGSAPSAASSFGPSSRAMLIGAEEFNPTNFKTGYIGEIVIAESLWSEADRQKVEGYLAHKWGLSSDLPVDHPYKNDPPLLTP